MVIQIVTFSLIFILGSLALGIWLSCLSSKKMNQTEDLPVPTSLPQGGCAGCNGYPFACVNCTGYTP